MVPEIIMGNMMITRKYGTSRIPEAHRRDEGCSKGTRTLAHVVGLTNGKCPL